MLTSNEPIFQPSFLCRITAAIALIFMSTIASAVEIVESVDKATCSLVKHNVCSTRRSNSYQLCREWHKRSASRVGASHVVITDFVDHKSFLFIGSRDQIPANYFDCSDGQDRAKTSTGYMPTVENVGP